VGVRAVVKIDGLNFGVITIGGTKYWMRDVVIFPDGTVRRRRFGRWLAKHHKYAKEDIADLVSAGAEVIVVGTGLFSGVRLTGDIRDCANDKICEIIDLPSRNAIEKINEQGSLGERTGALIHLLC
jgi:hypothetical protein